MVHTPARVHDDAASAASYRAVSFAPFVPVPTPDDHAFMMSLADDSNDLEESPWMSMGDLQFWSASSFAYALTIYAQRTGRDWYVASMLPITFPWPLPPHLRPFDLDEGEAERLFAPARSRTLAPDTLVAPDAGARRRSSFDLVGEGGFPPFVLEVVSPSSITRDEQQKRRAYDLLGAREYVVFTPREGQASTLAGWRRGESQRFEEWGPDAEGALWSEVLGLFIVARGERVIARTTEGVELLTPEEEADGRSQEHEERLHAEAARQEEAEGRRRAEEEVARLRVEIERLRHGGDVLERAEQRSAWEDVACRRPSHTLALAGARARGEKMIGLVRGSTPSRERAVSGSQYRRARGGKR